MTVEKNRQEEIYQSLFKKGIIISEEESREQTKNWHKTAIVTFEGNDNFIIKFNTESINNFFDQIRQEPEYAEYSASRTYFLDLASLFNDQVIFYATREDRRLPNVADALKVLSTAPFLTSTTSSIQARLR